MRRDDRDAYSAWLWGEVLLLGLLGAALALFVSYPSLRDTFELPQLRLVLDTAVTLAAAIVAVLAGIRFSVEGRRLDFLLCGGFFIAAASTFAFSIVPVFEGGTVGEDEAWAGIAGKLLATGLIAAAPFTRGRILGRQRALRWWIAALTLPRDLDLAPRQVGLERDADAHHRRRPAAAPDLPARPAGAPQPRRPPRLRPSLSLLRGRPLSLARARGDAHALRRAALRVHAGRLELVRLAGRLPPADLLQRPAGRRLARDPLRRVRPSCRGGARPCRARDPRRSCAVPLHGLDPREHARGRDGESGSRRPPRPPSRRRGSRSWRCRRRAAMPPSTRRSAGTSTFSRRTASSRSSSTWIRRSPLRPTSRSRCSASSRKGSPMCASTRARAGPEVLIGPRGTDRVVVVRDNGAGFNGDTDPAGPGAEEPAPAGGGDRGRFHASLDPGPGHCAGSHAARVVL